MKDKDRKRETENLLGPLAEERFALLVNLGKKITDFNTKGDDAATTATSAAVDDTHGINVQFDDQSEDEDDEDMYGEVNDDEGGVGGDGDVDEGEEAADSSAIQAQNVSTHTHSLIITNYTMFSQMGWGP